MSDCSTHAFDTPDLLPCPFCGGEIRIKRYGDGMSSLDMYHEKGCVMREDLENGSFDRDDLPDVLAAWNTRAERECNALMRKIPIESARVGYVRLAACSECGCIMAEGRGMARPNPPNYCPGCGARVRG